MLKLEDRETETPTDYSQAPVTEQETNQTVKRAVIIAALCATICYLTYQINAGWLSFTCLALLLLLTFSHNKILKCEHGLAPLLMAAKLGAAISAVIIPALIALFFISINNNINTSHQPIIKLTGALVSLIPIINLALILNCRHNFLSSLSVQFLAVVSCLWALVAALCLAGTCFVMTSPCQGQSVLICFYLTSALSSLYLYRINWRKQLDSERKINRIATFCAALLSLLCFAPEAREISIVAAMDTIIDSPASPAGTVALNWLDSANASKDILNQLNNTSTSFFLQASARYFSRADGKAIYISLFRKSGQTAGNMKLLWQPPAHTFGYGNEKVIVPEQSKITAVVDSQTLTSAIYWIINLKNPTGTIQEALATIQLPPGACVTRATLWVNGKPEEASFNARAKVQEAYALTAGARRDPLLITSTRPGQIDLKAAPVPAYGYLTLRIGITAPLVAKNPRDCTLGLPYLLSSNMENTDTVYHFDSDRPLRTNFASSKLSNNDLKEFQATLHLDKPMVKIATRASHSAQKAFITETLSASKAQAISRVLVLVDNSRTIESNKETLKKVLQTLPNNIKVGLIGASADATEIEQELVEMTGKDRAVTRLAQLYCAGGPDNRSSVETALNIAGKNNDLSIFWIHGQQLDGLIGARHKETLPDTFNPSTQLVEWNVDNSVNELMDNALVPAYPILVERSFLPADLETQKSFWNNLVNPDTVYKLVFDKIAEHTDLPVSYDNAQVTRVSSLWAQQEALALLSHGQIAESEALGTAYRVVTPVTGATVLANDQDYKHYGLDRNFGKVVDTSVKSDTTTGARFVPATIADYNPSNWSNPSNSSFSSGPVWLQGATNGTIGPQGIDSIVISGVNTSGTVRINNAANLEVLANFLVGVISVTAIGGAIYQILTAMLKSEKGEYTAARIYTAVALALLAVVLPTMINQLFGLLRVGGFS